MGHRTRRHPSHTPAPPPPPPPPHRPPGHARCVTCRAGLIPGVSCAAAGGPGHSPLRHPRCRPCSTPWPADGPCTSICVFNKVPVMGRVGGASDVLFTYGTFIGSGVLLILSVALFILWVRLLRSGPSRKRNSTRVVGEGMP